MTSEHLILTAIGLAAGVIGGLLGVGGSIVMIPAMTIILGPAQHLYQGAAMIVNFFVVVPAVIQHQRAKAILMPVIAVMIPAAVVGVVAGVWLSNGFWFRGANEVYLSRVFGTFLLYDAAYNVYRLFSSRRFPDMDAAAARALPRWKTALVVGVPAGLVGGLLGIGGGAVVVPLQQLILRIPLRRAIANSAAMIIPVSFVGACYKNYSNAQAGVAFGDALRLAVFLIPTAIVGGYLGGRMTHAIPRRALRVAFIMLMCYAGISLIRRPARVPVPATLSASAVDTPGMLGARVKETERRRDGETERLPNRAREEAAATAGFPLSWE